VWVVSCPGPCARFAVCPLGAAIALATAGLCTAHTAPVISVSQVSTCTGDRTGDHDHLFACSQTFKNTFRMSSTDAALEPNRQITLKVVFGPDIRRIGLCSQSFKDLSEAVSARFHKVCPDRPVRCTHLQRLAYVRAMACSGVPGPLG
jgi:hypothetical protein